MFKFFRKKTTSPPTKSDRYFQIRIKEVKRETKDTVTLIFDQPEKPLEYLPGQFLTLILPIDGKKVRRSYSLCSSPYSDEFPAITVKRVEDGKVSNYLNDHMKVGDVFDVMEPAGHFVPDLKNGQKKDYMMFAAGSGITPIFSIIKSVLLVEHESRIILVYQNRDENSIIFKDALLQLQADYPQRFQQIVIFSQPTEKREGYIGRLDAAMVSDILLDIGEKNITQAEFYLCGPSGYMVTVFETLMDFAIPERQVHKESFFIGETKQISKESNDAGNQEYDVIIRLDGEEYNVNVPTDKTILEAALDQNIDMPFSCQSGLCTACRGKLLQGKVEMSEEDGLSDEEVAEGYILNCVSRPTGPDVIIEIG